jgi:5-(aminomethyl)-3-furanmethanol phosphate kinase
MGGEVLRIGARPALLTEQTQLIVIKLGGSVVRSGELSAWLDAIATAPQPIIVVPGGGALADEVRACQANLGFGDETAHRMALLAMDQLAWAVAGLRQSFEVGATEAELRAALDRGSVAVWAPYALIAGRSDVEESWALTSDSLALWLAARLGAQRCYLIKSILRKSARLGAKQLARDRVVDETFPAMLKDAHVPTFLLGRGDQQAFISMLAGAEDCGATID